MFLCSFWRSMIDQLQFRDCLLLIKSNFKQTFIILVQFRAEGGVHFSIGVSKLDFEWPGFHRFYRIHECLARIEQVLAKGGSRVINDDGGNWLLADVDEVDLYNMRAATGGCQGQGRQQNCGNK